MRTIIKNIYTFNELSEEAKKQAIENVRNSYYQYNDFSEWAIDDCYLLQPEELMNEDILIKNNRKIYFSLDRDRYIDISKAMEIQNSVKFLKWLGLDKKLIDKIDYDIKKDSIEFYNQSDKDFTENQQRKLDFAESKFNDHCEIILERIEKDIDYRFEDESIIEDINSNNIEFYENGDKH